MNTLIEIIGEKVQMAIDSGDRESAENIIQECEEWYENYTRHLSNPLDDPVFLAVYNYGYDNICWNDVQSSLEQYFQESIDEL